MWNLIKRFFVWLFELEDKSTKLPTAYAKQMDAAELRALDEADRILPSPEDYLAWTGQNQPANPIVVGYTRGEHAWADHTHPDVQAVRQHLADAVNRHDRIVNAVSNARVILGAK